MIESLICIVVTETTCSGNESKRITLKNQIFYYTRCTTLKLLTSLWGLVTTTLPFGNTAPFEENCNVGELMATPCLAQNLNLRPPAPKLARYHTGYLRGGRIT